MEPIHGRPPLGDMFFPTRITLNEDNDYLTSVGLIILIRGSPSPDLPRLITDKLIEIHGGHPHDFVVTQATISPYLVTCSNSHLRDTIVQRGIYTIPQARVKFTVHEWRPRFGMGYDPSTHQAWIKIIGLPLQAWTTPEITAILRSLGHPMQILPFGQEAGHHRDITALIAVKNLNQIPLAYTYREGDYATKIDIIILSSRTWDESYFPPPPEDNNSPYFSQSSSPNQAGPANPQPRSPFSSASSGLPSEPTVDLSAWSPRSRNLNLSISRIWDLQPTQSHPCSLKGKQIMAYANLLKEGPFFPSDSRGQITPYTQGKSHFLVTKDPNSSNAPLQCSSILCTLHTAVHNPIAINPLRSSWTINTVFLSLGEVQGILKTDSCYKISLARSRVQIGECTGKLSKASKLDLILSSEDETGLTEMTHNTQAQVYTNSSSRTLPLAPVCTLTLAQAQFPIPPSGRTQRPSHTDGIEVLLGNFSTPSPAQMNQSLSPISNGTIPGNTIPEQTSQGNSETQHNKNKQRNMPTRRSQRILEKRSTSGTEQSMGKRTRTQTTMIHFDKDSHQTPLDASKALQILQTTGLTINQQIEDMITEAVKQDQEMEDAEHSAPTTPLHDLIPPLAIPGTSMLL